MDFTVYKKTEEIEEGYAGKYGAKKKKQKNKENSPVDVSDSSNASKGNDKVSFCFALVLNT